MARLPHTLPMGPRGLPPRAAPLPATAAATALHTDGARVLRLCPRWARRRWWKAGAVGEPAVALEAASAALRRCLGWGDRAGGVRFSGAAHPRLWGARRAAVLPYRQGCPGAPAPAATVGSIRRWHD